jgi:hypothetical protein
MRQTTCPAVADVLLFMTGAYQRVEPHVIDGYLDELARPLFGVSTPARAERLAAQLAEFTVDEHSVAGLWLDEVVQWRHGHPMVIAAVGAEIGRRAGLDAGVFSTPHDWYAGVIDGDHLWLIDFGEPSGAPQELRRHCGHELAFAALSGLAARYTGPDAERLRRRAARMRDRLAMAPSCADPGPDLLAVL